MKNVSGIVFCFMPKRVRRAVASGEECVGLFFRQDLRRHQPDKFDKLPGVTVRRLSEPFTIHHLTLNLLPSPRQLLNCPHLIIGIATAYCIPSSHQSV
jgi:hypothetical protein